MPTPTQQPSTQAFLDIFDITNDMIIMSDGAASMVLSVSAMNFGLLSEDEQDATIYAYAALLNSLSFPVEIVISSQPKDVTKYLKYIQDQEEQTPNKLYQRRLQEYRLFVESLVQEQNVLDKKFYIVIPLSAIEMGLSAQSVMPGSKAKPLTSYEKNFIIEKAATNLFPRRDHVIDQLARIGLYSRQLTTQELIQMLYASYNPESFEGQKVTDTNSYTTPLVQAQLQGGYVMADQTATPPNINPAGDVAQPTIDTTTPPTQTPPTPTPAPPMPAPTQPTPTAGFTTPPDMGTQPPAPLGMPQSPSTTQAPTAGVLENASIVPPVTPPPTSPMTAIAPPAVNPPEEQSTINQTLGDLGAQPINTAPAQPPTQA